MYLGALNNRVINGGGTGLDSVTAPTVAVMSPKVAKIQAKLDAKAAKAATKLAAKQAKQAASAQKKAAKIAAKIAKQGRYTKVTTSPFVNSGYRMPYIPSGPTKIGQNLLVNSTAMPAGMSNAQAALIAASTPEFADARDAAALSPSLIPDAPTNNVPSSASAGGGAPDLTASNLSQSAGATTPEKPAPNIAPFVIGALALLALR